MPVLRTVANMQFQILSSLHLSHVRQSRANTLGIWKDLNRQPVSLFWQCWWLEEDSLKHLHSVFCQIIQVFCLTFDRLTTFPIQSKRLLKTKMVFLLLLY